MVAFASALAMIAGFSPMIGKPARIGIVGTGFIGRGLNRVLGAHKNLSVGRVLTRRKLETVEGFEGIALTNSVEDLIEHSDLVVECSGDVIRAAEVIDQVLAADLPVVTM